MKKTTSLRYSSKFINRNFRLKVSGVDNFGNRINKLVGVAGMITLIRRGLKISFYSK